MMYKITSQHRMEPSIRSRCSVNSRGINSLAILLNVLSLSYLVLASAQSTTDDAVSYSTLSTPEECARECVVNETKTCYYQFTIEMYSVGGEACDLCTPNNTGIVNECECVLADGYEKTIMVVNRRLPGPTIEVCLGDKVIVDVTNHVPGVETSIHFHGLYQSTTPYFDGVPFLTQCPISQGNTFRYQWFAENIGTHFWHSHSGLQELDGVMGGIIIRKARADDVSASRYDYDLSEHLMIISDWMHEDATAHLPGLVHQKPGQKPDAVLINGMGKYTDPVTGNVTSTPLAEFVVSPGYRYRFRIVTAFATVCWGITTFEKHSLEIIGLDGEPVAPTRANTINSFAGERLDFVLTADQPPGVYWIQLRAGGECSLDSIQQLAILRYEGISGYPSSDPPTYNEGLPKGVEINPTDGLCETKRDDAICISHMENLACKDKAIFEEEADVKLQMAFQFFFWSSEVVFEPKKYRTFLYNEAPLLSVINNISFEDPPSPPLSQPDDVPAHHFCNSENLPADCETPCPCTHTIDIPTNSIVEIVLIDTGGLKDLMHPFHLHGHIFYVVAMGTIPPSNTTKSNADRFREMDENGEITRNNYNPPPKDTIPVPSSGYVIMRFRANNPGYWFMHCHFVFHMGIGMDFILHVGNRTELPPVPPNFPTCGNYLPSPDYGNKWADPSTWG